MVSFTEQFVAARKVSAPLIQIETTDPANTIQWLLKECAAYPQSEARKSPPGGWPVVSWDCITGLSGKNPAGDKAVARLGDEVEWAVPISFLENINNIDPMSLVIMHGANDWIETPVNQQAIWNLRDNLKQQGKTLVMLVNTAKVPARLQNDIIVLEEPLPSEEDLAGLVKKLDSQVSRCCKDSSCPKCGGTGVRTKRPLADAEAVDRIVESVKGVSAFGAEQIVSMALRPEPVKNQRIKACIDLDHCWQAKRKMISQTKGLSVYRGGETFDSIGGLQTIKTYLSRIMTGRRKPKVIIWLDEIEKTGLTATGDSSGVNKDQEGTLLSYMEDYDVFGVMLLGVPGCGKSAICKAVGAEFERVVIRVDLGAMQGSLVGESQENLRNALRIITAIGGESALWLATSNSIRGLSGAMKSRFCDTFFFDLPSADERKPIWDVWMRLKELKDDYYTEDDGWAPRDIKHCCDKAYRMNIPVSEAAAYITPVGVTDRESIRMLREDATDRYLSANHPGLYCLPKQIGERSMMI